MNGENGAGRRYNGDVPDGHVTQHHRFILEIHWDHLNYPEWTIALLDERIEDMMRPFEADVQPPATIIAVAHSILVIAYCILRDRTPYHELGTEHYDRLRPDRLRRYYIRAVND